MAVNATRRLPLLQARHPVPARTRRRLGDQRRVASSRSSARPPRRSRTRRRREPCSRSPASWACSSPAAACGSTRSAPARSRRRCSSTSTAATRRRSSGGGSTGRPGDSRSRARSSNGCAVPRERRVLVRERRDVPRRRRPDGRVRDAGVDPPLNFAAVRADVRTTCLNCGDSNELGRALQRDVRSLRHDGREGAVGLLPTCVIHTRIEIVTGLRRLTEYLAAWAAFDDWCRAQGAGPTSA